MKKEFRSSYWYFGVRNAVLISEMKNLYEQLSPSNNCSRVEQYFFCKEKTRPEIRLASSDRVFRDRWIYVVAPPAMGLPHATFAAMSNPRYHKPLSHFFLLLAFEK